MLNIEEISDKFIYFQLLFQSFSSFPSYNNFNIEMAAKEGSVINLHNLTALLQQIQKSSSFKLIKRKQGFDNDPNVEKSPFQQIFEMAQKLNERAASENQNEDFCGEQQKGSSWAFGEQKLFCSILPYFCQYLKIKISSLSLNQVNPLTSIFITKTSQNIFFEIKHISNLKNSVKTEWTQFDLQNLYRFVLQTQMVSSKKQTIEWKQISFSIFLENNCTCFHSARDCREKWINHINPGVSKASWQANQDLELFLNIKKYGCKWALISKNMGGTRTEHMVKNRVNALIKRYIKRKTKKMKAEQIELIINHIRSKGIQQPYEQQNNKQALNLDPISKEEKQISTNLEGKTDSKQQQLTLINYSTNPQNLSLRLLETEQDWQYSEPNELLPFYLLVSSPSLINQIYHEGSTQNELNE